MVPKEQEFDPIKDCIWLIQNNKIFQNAPLYFVPLSSMWERLTNTLQNSCCSVYKKLLQYIYWSNTNTKN